MHATRPNILWISFEDCNPRYGCYGDRVARTPNLDRFAADGCMWPLAYSTAPVCSPARSAVITGMYPISIGTHHHRTNSGDHFPSPPYSYSAVVPHYVKCFTEYLRAAGYYCTNNAKTDYQFTPPVTAWDECNPRAHWRNRPDPEQPFFAVFNLGRTHESGMWPETVPALAFDPGDVEVPPYFPDTPKVREAIARNYTNIEHNDRRFGELLAELEQDGLADKTIVFHWSDHGPSIRGKRWPYEAGIHVPMMVRGPGAPAPGTVSDRLVSTIDLGPTVLSLTGVPVPRHMQGKAFLGPAAEPAREYVFVSRDRFDEMYDMVRAARDRRFKYIRHFHPEAPYLLWNSYRNKHPIMQEMWRCRAEGTLTGAQLDLFRTSRPPEELFDVENDPHELNNLAGDPAYRADLERLRDALDAWRREVGDLGEVPEDIMFRTMYPDGRQPETLPPRMILLGPHAHGDDNDPPAGGTVRGPVLLQLQSGTQGASIAYAIDDGPKPRWQLYCGPFALPPGDSVVRAKAIRIGYAESPEIRALFTVT